MDEDKDALSGEKEDNKRGPLTTSQWKGRSQDDRIRLIITCVAVLVWGFCTVVSTLRYFTTGQSDFLEWLIALVMGAIVAYYFWARRENSRQE